MRFHVNGHLEYAVSFPSTLILNIHAQRNSTQTILDEHFVAEPYVKVEEFVLEPGGSRFVRLETGRKKKLTIDYTATVDVSHEVVAARDIDHTPVAEMDRKAIPYLFPSRYCQSDRLGRLAWDLFGKIPNPYDKVMAIVDWIHSNVEYLRGSTSSETSAYDTVTQRTGVCRDFAHLGIALCRALNIPSRYFSGYSFQLEPPDFHACFESYVGGRWLVFDATGLAPLNGLVRIGTGRDAADAAVASIFGRVMCTNMSVDCQLESGQKFSPLTRKQLSRKGISLEASHVAPAN
jgi:transglutaminase-like putative cysteine protease